MRKKINKTLALLMAFALCFSSVNIQAFAQIINDTEQAVINTTEETTVEETAEGEVLTESITEQELSTQTQETTENEQTTDVEGVSTEVEETVSEGESVIESQTQTEEATTVEEVIAEAETEESTVTESETNNWDGVTTENIYEADNYKVTFILASYWDTGFNANIKIENTGDTVIQNWYLNLDFDSEISNIWNGQIYEKTQSGYIIKNAGWNQDIAVGCAVEFGISGNETFKGFPKSYELTGISTEVKTEDYGITYSIESDWGSGFTGSIAIANNTNATLEDWVLEFDFDREITEIWNGVIEEHEGNHYVVRNTDYNSNIAIGTTVSIGFKGGAASEMTEPENYKLYSYNADKSNIGETDSGKDTDNDKVNIFFETNGGSEIASQEVNYGEVPEFPEFPVKENTSFVGWYFDENLENIYNFESPITEDTILYAKWDEDVFTWDSRIDTDKDGLPDGYEILYDITDSKKEETTDGILDADVDFDQDNFTMLEEYQNDTDPINPDTDGDGLLDGNECKIYSTNPLVADTDGDGLFDGDELLAGLDPLNPSTFGYSDTEYLVELEVEENSDLVSYFNNNNSEYQVSLKVKGSADINSAIKINNSKAYDSMKSDLVLGNAVEIKMDKCNNIDNLNISIRIMENNINDKYSNEELKGIKRYNIFFFDEANQILIPIETSFDESNNIICSQITKSGTYCVVDMERWLSELGFESFDTTETDEEEISLLCDDELFFESVDLISAASGMNLYTLDSETLEDEITLMNELTDIEEIYDVTNTLDLVFCINNNVEGLTNTEFQSIVNNLLVLGETAFSKTKDVHVYIIDQHGVPVSTPFGQKYATNKNEITLMINQLANSSPKEQYIDKQINSMIDDLGLRVSANKIAIFFGNSYLSGNSYNLIPRVKEANIHCVIVCPKTQPGSWYDTLKKETEGLLVYSYSDFLEPTLEYIYGYVPNIPHSFYNIILSNTLKIVMLDDEIKFNGKTDTDGDSLTDWNEIEQDKISVNADNTISLLTYKEYLSKYCFSYNLFLSNFAKIKNKNGKSLDDFLNTIYVLPVKTDPSKADTDNDGVNDNFDPYPLKNHSFATLDEYLTTDTWGSKYFNPDADDLEYVSNPREYYDSIVIHHSNRSQNEKITALEKHETKYNSNHFNGIPYHFVINGSGTIYEGRPINYKGSHVADNNTGRIGVCLMGNFQSDNNGIKQIIKSALPTTPTDSQYEAMEELIKVLETQYYTQYSGGHKDFVMEGNEPTVCPGNNCYTMLQDDGYIKLP